MPIDPPDGGPDDWFVPPSSAAGTAQPASGPQLSPANPALASRPAPRPDPLAAYWASIPASRAGAMAWHPPIFLNSPGQSPPPAPASLDPPWTGPPVGLLRSFANPPGPSALPYGLLRGIANLPSANPAAVPFRAALDEYLAQLERLHKATTDDISTA